MSNKKYGIIIVVVLLFVVGVWLAMRKTGHGKPVSNIAAQQSSAALKQMAQQQAVHDALVEQSKTDADLDGLSDADEAKYKTDPHKPDTDGDGILDRDEIFLYHTDPLKADTDGDGYSDGYEVRHHTNPLVSDKK